MHIVIDARSRPSSTGRYIDRLIDHLQKIDQNNRYTILLKPGDTWEPVSNNFTSVVCKYKLFSFNILDQITFARFLYQLKPDLVHFGMTPQEPLFYFGKQITTTHDLTMLRYARPGRLPIWLHKIRMIGYRFIFYSSHLKAKRVIVPSEFVAQDLAEKYPFTSSKTVVTYESSEPPLKTVAEPLPGVGKLFIVHVGSPLPHKNIERLVDAFEIMKEKYPSLQLVLAGKKEFYFNQLEKYVAKSPVKDSIIIPGFVSDEQLKWLYQNAVAYVLPALSEGFGLPGLEAMSHGCVLISSNATCLPEIYGKAALYFNPYDITGIVKQVSRVISDHTIKNEMVKLGKIRLRKYSWSKMARETLEIYNSI